MYIEGANHRDQDRKIFLSRPKVSLEQSLTHQHIFFIFIYRKGVELHQLHRRIGVVGPPPK
jgi:hypothetical protein